MSGPAAKSKALADNIHAKGEKFTQGTTIPGLAGYPIKYFEKDKRDDYYKTKSAVAEGLRAGNALSRLGTTLPITEKDLDYLQDQKTKEEKKIFDTWKYSTFKPGSDPVRQKYFEKIDPSWYKEREQEIERVFGLIQKLALLSLNSVRTPEDMVLLYGLNSGRIPFPDWKVYVPFEFQGQAAMGIEPEFIDQGYWNPRRYVIENPTIKAPEIYQQHPLITSARHGTDLDLGNNIANYIDNFPFNA